MSQAEIPSSVLLEYKPSSHGIGTLKTAKGNNPEVIELRTNKSRADTNTTRVLHIRKRQNEKSPVTTIAITPGEHYDRFMIKDGASNIARVAHVNNSHLLFGFTNLGNRGGEISEKFGFNGERIEAESSYSQMPLGLYEDVPPEPSTKAPLAQEQAVWLPEMPVSLPTDDINHLKKTIELIGQSKPIPYEEALRLGQVFHTLAPETECFVQASLALTT